MASADKRRRQKANRAAAREAALPPVPALTDDVLASLLAEVTVRDDCGHAATRDTGAGLVLLRCDVGADVAGGCPTDCPSFEFRRAGGLGLGAG